MAAKLAVMVIITILLLLACVPLLGESRSVMRSGETVPAAAANATSSSTAGGKLVIVVNSRGTTTTRRTSAAAVVTSTDAEVNDFCGDFPLCSQDSECSECPDGCCSTKQCICRSCVYTCS